MTTNQPDDAFVRNIHRALRHMYEPVELRLSPLVGLFQIKAGADVPSSLRTILLKAINGLKPGPKVPLDSNAWRIHQVLCYRFEEQFSQEEVAEQMAISPRQVRRLEFTAIRALADSLARQYAVDQQAPQQTPSEEAETADVLPELSAQAVQAQIDEFDWLKKNYQEEMTDLGKLVEGFLKISEPLLKDAGVKIDLDIPPNLPPVIGQMTTLRQALLNLLIAGVRSCPPGRLFLAAQHDALRVHLDIWSERVDAETEPCETFNEFIDISCSLAELSGGQVERLPASAERPFHVRLSVRSVQQYKVLAVDDNEDILRLLHRYLEGTVYELIAVDNASQVIPLAEHHKPNVILLDIMLPNIDGWEMLGRLRAHPLLSAVPVIITTILPHEQLAVSLGASGFLRKPVSREALLKVLSQLAGFLGTELH